MGSHKTGMLAILCFMIINYTESTPFDKSKDGPSPLTVEIDGCTKLPCTFKRGTNVTAYADFKAISDTTTLTPVVKVTILGITSKIPYNGSTGCDSLAIGSCPLTEGDTARYSVVVPVLKTFPEIRATLELSVIGDNKKTEFSFKLPIKIK